MISSTNADDADIQREITNMFVRTNILLRRFSLCSNNVKLCCSKPNAYVCMMLPCGKPIIWAHWASFAPVIILCVKIFFGYRRCDSMTNILLTLGLPSFNTVLANASISFAKQWANCSNRIIRVMRNMDLNYWEWCLHFTLFHFIFPVYYIYVCRLSVVISCELLIFCMCMCMLVQSISVFPLVVFYGPCCLK